MMPRAVGVRTALVTLSLMLCTACGVFAQDSTAVVKGDIPFTNIPDTAYVKKAMFPLWMEKVRARGMAGKLPPPYGILLINNWMASDWRFLSAAVDLGGSNPITIDAAANATMELDINTRGVKGDIWILPMADFMVGYGEVDVDAQLGLRDIPVAFDVGSGYTYADAIVPMKFTGTYYSVGGVVAGAYKHLYAAADFNWLKTSLNGDASLSSEGFWTFTAAPKFGYNAGLSQLYIGARYISKNEHYEGTVDLPSGNPLGFDVRITTDTWAPNAGMRTIIHNEWEFLLEVAGGKRHQITVGGGYRW